MASEVAQSAIGGAGKRAEIDGGYFGGYVRPANRRENRRDRREDRRENAPPDLAVAVDTDWPPEPDKRLINRPLPYRADGRRQLFFHLADPPVAGRARGDLSAILDDLDFIKRQLAQMPTRNEVWRAAMLGMLGGAVAAVTLIEAFARSSL